MTTQSNHSEPAKALSNQVDNRIVVSGPYGSPIEIDLDDLQVEHDYEPQMYYAPTFEARRSYTFDPKDDVFAEYSGDAIHTLLDIVKQLNRRVRQLEQVIDLVATDSDTTNSPSNPPNKHGAGLEEADHE